MKKQSRATQQRQQQGSQPELLRANNHPFIHDQQWHGYHQRQQK
jgi:hypothetical protein